MRSPPTTDQPASSLYTGNSASHWPVYSRNTEEPAWMLTQSQAFPGQYSGYYGAPHQPLAQSASDARPSSADSTPDPNWLPTPQPHQPSVSGPYSPREFSVSAVNYQSILSPVSSSPPYDSRLTMDYPHPRAVSALITATPTLSTANPVPAPIDYSVRGPAASTALSFTPEVLRPARQGPIGSNVSEHEARTSNPVTLPAPVSTSTRSGTSPSPPPAKRRRTTRRRSTASASTSGSASSSALAYSSSSSSFTTAPGFDSGIVCSLGSCSNEPFATIYLHARHVAHEHMVHSCSHIPETSIAELKQWLVQQGGMTSASRESALKTYLKRKRDEREGMLECTRCGRVFGRKDARMKHVKKGGCVAGRPAPGTRTAIRRQTAENAPLSAASMVLPALQTSSIRVETNLPPPPTHRASGDSPVATLVTLRDGTIAYGSPTEEYRLQPTYASVHTSSPPTSAYLTPSSSYAPPQFSGYVFGSQHGQDGTTSQHQSHQHGYVDPQFYNG